MRILVIGGTRNLGHLLVYELTARGHTVTVFNRGRTRDELPENIERLRGDRADSAALTMALGSRKFDAVVDTALYKGEEAEAITRVLNGKVGHYVFISTGQVYLVREGTTRPFTESQYAGRVMPAPKPDTYVYEEWLYGVNKRAAEDKLQEAFERNRFPVTTMRLPMVNGERDHFGRLYGYVLRLKDGGPILVPSTPNHPLRHVYSHDVVRGMVHLIESGAGIGKAYNFSQDETTTLDEFLGIIGGIMDVEPKIVRVQRDLLEANGFVPDSSPFSERWMSELDNTVSKQELGMKYTPLRDYLNKIVRYYLENSPPIPVGYKRRRAEITFFDQVIGQVGEISG
jgi:nucleoside-diphosphate-sugar epimerase